MRRILTAVLCLALLLSGCVPREQDALLGTWYATVDLSDAINADFADDPALGDYVNVTDFCFPLTLAFSADGTYCVRADRSGLGSALAELKAQLAAAMEQYVQSLLDGQQRQISARDYLAAMGLTPEDLLDHAYTEETVEKMLSAMDSQGNFQVEEGKLFLSNDVRYAVATDCWELYRVEGNKLTVEAGGMDSPYAELIYPMEYTRLVEEE